MKLFNFGAKYNEEKVFKRQFKSFKKLTFYIIVERDSLSPSQVENYINRDVRVKSYGEFDNYKLPISNGLNDLKKRKEKDENFQGMFFDDEGEVILSIASPFPYILPSFSHIYIYIEKHDLNQEEMILEAIEKSFSSIKAIYCLSEMDRIYNNNLFIESFSSRNWEYDKAKIIKNEVHGELELDLVPNPGLARPVIGMNLMSCWRMWFYRNDDGMVDIDGLGSFEGANQNKMINEDLRFIELYENPYDAAKPENRALQQKLRDFLQIERLYKECTQSHGFRF